MGHRSFRGVVPFVAAVAAWGVIGCSKADPKQEVVATANGDVIRVVDVRDALAGGGGTIALPDVPPAKKREALDRAIAVRLLVQEARAKGFDNTAEFKSVIGQNARGVLINALFRREVANGFKVSDDDVKARGKKLRESDNALTEANANGQARLMLLEERVRKIEEDLIASARKEFPVAVDRDLVIRMGKGEKMQDNAVLGTAGADKLTCGEARKLVDAMAGGPHAAKDIAQNPVAIARLVEREVTGMALAAYARKQGIEGSEWTKSVREELERSVLFNILAEKEVFSNISVSDKEIAAAYAEHSQMFVRDGRKVPVSEVKPQIREFLMNEKRRKAIEAYVADLKKKAKITVKEEVLSKV